jgi:methionyl-tRNA formyltransferase
MVEDAAATAPLRVVYFGTPAFAVPTLEALVASRHQVVAVVTQPDRPRGRGHRISESPVKALAGRHGLPLLQPDRLKTPEALDAIRAFAPDLGVVAAYGKILPQALLDIPGLGLLNVHASLLPAYRGAAPVHRAVMAGERVTGVTIMRVVLALDAGPTLSAHERPIDPDETSEDVERDLARVGAPLLLSAVEALAAGRAVETPQDDTKASYAARLTKADSPMDWRRPAQALHDQVRGLHPWPHASTVLDGARYLVHRTSAAPGAHGVEPGTVLEAAGGTFTVAAGGGTALAVIAIQPEGRRVMQVREFLAGRRIPAGARFSPAPDAG